MEGFVGSFIGAFLWVFAGIYVLFAHFSDYYTDEEDMFDEVDD